MKPVLLVSVAAALLPVCGPAFAQGYTYRSIEVSCDAAAVACPAGLAPGTAASQTSARGINARGDVVGFYIDAAGRQHGFLLSEGQYRSVDVPGARGTVVNGINAAGEMVGSYLAPLNADASSPLYCPSNADAACSKGFYYGRGTFMTVTYEGHPGSVLQRITAAGDIYGCLHDHDTGMSMFGAVWSRSFGPHQSVELTPRASLEFAGGQTSDPMAVPMSMTNGGGGAQTLAGFFVDMTGRTRGYLVQDGILQSYDAAANTSLTAIWDMNAELQFVGTYRLAGEPGARRHGFTQRPDGSPAVTIDISVTDASGNTTTAFSTIALGINPAGVIVGQYVVTAGGPAHGFIAVPVSSN